MRNHFRELRVHIKDATLSLIDQYTNLFSEHGVTVNLSIKQIDPILCRSAYHHEQVSIFTVIEDAVKRLLPRRNKQNTSVRSPVLCVVIRFSLLDSKKNIGNKEYAFLIKHLEKDYEKTKEKLLWSVQKLFKKKLGQLAKKPATCVCRENVMDVLRYACISKYFYKKEANGIDLNIARFILFISVGVIFLLLYLLEWVLNGFSFTSWF